MMQFHRLWKADGGFIMKNNDPQYQISIYIKYVTT